MKNSIKLIIVLLLFPFHSHADSVLAYPSSYPAQNNVTVVYDVLTGNVLMTVVDANNLSDPAWNPPGGKQIPVPVATFNAMDADQWQAYLNTILPPNLPDSR